jgi:hypothetical protein
VPAFCGQEPNPDKPELNIDDLRLKICGIASLCLFYWFQVSGVGCQGWKTPELISDDLLTIQKPSSL